MLAIPMGSIINSMGAPISSGASLWDKIFPRKQQEEKPSIQEKLQDALVEHTQNPSAEDAIKADRAWAEAQAQKQMEFQERMSSTAYQRLVKDLEKAGLNPALAHQLQGASSALGAMAQSGSTQQQADLQRERSMFGLLEVLIMAVSGVASSAIGALGGVAGSKLRADAILYK